MRSVRITVRGRVQGVGYRDWIVRRARALKLDGWVRNRSDGSVEIMASGEGSAVEELVQAAHRGPPSAHVTEARVEDSDEEVGVGFALRPTV